MTPSHANPKPHARLESLIWILIYAGVLAVVLGIVVADANGLVAWLLAVPGSLGVIAGIVLIVVRSRMPD